MRRLPNVYINVFDNGGGGGISPEPSPVTDGNILWYYVV